MVTQTRTLRYQTVINVVVHRFSHCDFDALFMATNATGKNAFNRVERKMAPLSKELTVDILNERGITIDADLEKKNFQFAVNTLA